MIEFVEKIKPHVQNLIDIVNSIGTPMEGSLFYDDQVTNMTLEQIKPDAYNKATSLVNFAIGKDSILEIGFNSGFSALVMLFTNPTLKITSVDLCAYPYSIPCYEYLKETFKDRINLIKGSSTEVLPDLLKDTNNFDGYFIDGGHSDEVTGSDFKNILAYCKNGSDICADDYNFPVIKNIVHYYIDENLVVPTTVNEFNIFLKVIK